MSAQLELVLRGDRNEDQISVFIEPTEIPLAKRWISELRRTLGGPHFLEKDQCFAGFLDGRRNQAYLCAQLNELIAFFRDLRAPGLWEKGYDIPEHCSVENLGPPLLNRIHHHFETLRGQLWNPSSYVHGLSPAGSNAVRRLNVLVHQLEALEHSKSLRKSEGRICPYSSVHFLEPKSNNPLPLEDEDYDFFSFEESFGLIQMHYCQIGKTHLHAWSDGDTDIFDENINNLRVFSAGFAIGWTEHLAGVKRYDPFLEWLKARGVALTGKNYFVDRYGNKQGLGYLNVGRIPLRQFGGRSPAEIQTLVGLHDDIYKIRLHENGQVLERTYDYRVDDRNYDELIVQAFPKS